jgi:hypothetical protein
MAGHLLCNSGSNESSRAPQFKWLDNTFKGAVQRNFKFVFFIEDLYIGSDFVNT